MALATPAHRAIDGGGKYTVDTYAWFNCVDYDLNEAWTLNAGLRYTYEKKKADIASAPLNTNAPCNVLEGTCPIDFSDDKDWNSWSPKAGATYALSDNAMLYGHWTLGYRSGGYNLRNTADAELWGIEADGTFRLLDKLIAMTRHTPTTTWAL